MFLFVITVVVFLVILTVLVIIHEAGHYFTAKYFNIKVEEFGFGFPPRAFSIQRGETLYSINWLPIGGFVKLYGEDDAGGGKLSVPSDHTKNAPDTARAFYAKPAWQRALVIFAGVVMNTILAIIIFYAFLLLSQFKTELPILGNMPDFIGVQTTAIPAGVMIENIEKGSPAYTSGVQSSSIVLSVNHKKIATSSQFIRVITENKGKKVLLSLVNVFTGQMQTVSVVPRMHIPKNQGALGVGLADSPYNSVILDYHTPTQQAFSGISHSANMIIYTLVTFDSLINTSVKEHSFTPVATSVSGPVGIISIVNLILQIPSLRDVILQLLNLAGLLSISLAFFNVLPIPALDGGRLFFIIIELVSGRKINPRTEGYANAVGMALLLGLIVLITIKDIAQFVHPL